MLSELSHCYSINYRAYSCVFYPPPHLLNFIRCPGFWIFNAVPTLVTMFWRGVFAAESCSIPNTISLTLAAPHHHQRPPYTHKKHPHVHYQELTQQNRLKKKTLEPQDMQLYSGRKTPQFRRNLLPPPSHLYYHFFLTCKTLFYPRTVSTSLSIGSLNFWDFNVP